MKRKNKTFLNTHGEHGGMLVELMLSIALAMIVIPFVFRYHNNAVRRTENIAVTRQMAGVQTALERYIAANRVALLAPVGKNITRVELTDLVEFGLDEDLLDTHGTKYQLRVLKSADSVGQATLQGVIVLDDDTITPLRTREIVNIAGDTAGFVDSGRAYGAFGAWRTTTADLGIAGASGIVETTGPLRDNAKYLMRVPSADASDATMASVLNMGGHDIVDAAFFNARAAVFDENLTTATAAASDVVFRNRTSVDGMLGAASATVSGALSSDGKALQVAGNISMSDTAKFSGFEVADLYASNMTLAGITLADTDHISTLKINRALDMTQGRIEAMYVTVGFAGSITPRLTVSDRIEDSVNSSYYWDVADGTARFVDLSLGELSRMAVIVASEPSRGVSAEKTFSAVATNRNATVADYARALDEISRNVRQKYRQLNLD